METNDYRSILVKRYYSADYDIIRSEVLMVEGENEATRDDIEEAAYALGSVREPFVSYDDPRVAYECIGDFDERYKQETVSKSD